MEFAYCEERVSEQRPVPGGWWGRWLDRDARLSAALRFADGRWRLLAKAVARSGDAVFWLAAAALALLWGTP